jgi:heterodisulfide reductase subunit A
MHPLTAGQIRAQVDTILEDNTENSVPVFARNWCSYARVYFACVNRFQYPGQLPPGAHHVLGLGLGESRLHAFAQRAPVALVNGCHISAGH